jgi:hypothetical protein
VAEISFRELAKATARKIMRGPAEMCETRQQFLDGAEPILEEAFAALSRLEPDREWRLPDELRELSEEATPGPWSWEQCGEKHDDPVIGVAFPGDDPDCKRPYEGEFRDSDAYRESIALEIKPCDGRSATSNAAFIVAAVNFVRRLAAAGKE